MTPADKSHIKYDVVMALLGDMTRERDEYKSLWEGAKRQSDRWRGIASAMGYEPNAHDDVKPKEKWLTDRISKYRAEVAATDREMAA